MLTISTLVIILIVAISTFAVAADWTPLGPPSALDVQPKMRVAAATTAILPAKATDGSPTWVVCTVNSAVWWTKSSTNSSTPPVWAESTGDTPASCGAIHVSKYNSSRVYVASGASTSSQQGYDWSVLNDAPYTGLFASNDGGLSFKRMPGFSPGHSVHAILETASGALLVGTRGHFNGLGGGGIWRIPSYTTSTSTNFTKVFSSPVMNLFEDTVAKKVYASGAGRACSADKVIVVSSDAGHAIFTSYATTGIDFGYLGTSMRPYWSVLAGVSGKALYLLVNLASATSDPSTDWYGAGVANGAVNLYYLDLSGGGGSWKKLGGQPMQGNPNIPKGQFCKQTCQSYGAPPKTAWTDCCRFGDGDGSQKDKGGLAVASDDPMRLYYVGNGGYTTYRIDVATAVATTDPCTINTTAVPPVCSNSPAGMSPFIFHPMSNQGKGWPKETAAGLQPHVDFRYATIDPGTGNLVVTSDGGAFVRTFPAETGGKRAVWRDFVGQGWGFEYTAAALSLKTGRAVGAAQDNCVHVTAAAPQDRTKASGLAFTFGDGLVADATNDGDRDYLLGSNQFLWGLSSVDLSGKGATTNEVGYFVNNATSIEADPSHGISLRGGNVAPPLQQTAVPFFQPAAGLNRVNRSSFCSFFNRTSNVNDPSQGGVYCWNPWVKNSKAKRVMGSSNQNILSFVAGVGNKESNVIGMSNTHLFVQSGSPASITTQPKLFPFPQAFAQPCGPVVVAYCNSTHFGQRLVPCTASDTAISGFDCSSWPNHFKTVSLGVWDMDRVAVTGWQQLNSNSGTEHIFLTRNGGTEWLDVIGDLCSVALTAVESEATGGLCRPGALAFLSKNILVAGTSTQMLFTDLSQADGKKQQHWKVLGKSFPRVKVSSSTFYPAAGTPVASSDPSIPTFAGTLVIATMGRSIFSIVGPVESSSGMTAGTIVGIVFACLVVGVAVTLGVWYFKLRKGPGDRTEAYNEVNQAEQQQQAGYSAHGV